MLDILHAQGLSLLTLICAFLLKNYLQKKLIIMFLRSIQVNLK